MLIRYPSQFIDECVDSPKIVGKLHLASQAGELTINEIIGFLSELQEAVLNSKGKGILIIFDELGKFLEYEARHYGANDIYLLQALAEHAYLGQGANIYIYITVIKWLKLPPALLPD